MKTILQTLFLSVILLLIIVLVVVLLGLGLNWLWQFIPCEVYGYIVTGLLLGIFMLVTYLIVTPKGKAFVDFLKREEISK